MKAPRAQTTTPDAAQQAAEWMVRLESHDCGARDDLRRWLRQSPDHVNELARAIHLDRQLRSFDPERRIDVEQLLSAAGRNVVPLRSNPHAPSYRIRLVGAALACALTAGFVALWIFMTSASNVLGANTTDYEPEQQQRVQLSDGSWVDMAPKSRLRVRLDHQKRTAVLSEGRVTFTVALDVDNPFFVHVGRIVLTTNGAKFAVSRRNEETHISVAAGRLRVRRDILKAVVDDVVDYDYNLSPGAELYIYDTGERDTEEGRIKVVRAADAPARFAALR